MTPGTITRLADGRYAVAGMGGETVVATEALAKLVAARVRKAFGVAEPKGERVKRTVRHTRRPENAEISSVRPADG